VAIWDAQPTTASTVITRSTSSHRLVLLYRRSAFQREIPTAMSVQQNTFIDPLGKVDRARSDFVRQLVQCPGAAFWGFAPYREPPLRLLVQFWDDLARLPHDVKQCIDSWQPLRKLGFDIQLFDENAARHFIRTHLGLRFENAFNKCYHPSMKSDYFRYSYIFAKGGFYIDADDVYHGTDVEHLFGDGRLKLQPFCYDISTARMVARSEFAVPGADQLSWIFYFNTTPLIAGRHHPIVERALLNSTMSLEQAATNELPEVQASTGPGNLTRSVFEVITESRSSESFLVVHDWEKTSTSKWPLSYRNDRRNWRLSNQQEYKAPPSSEMP
jgi:hypothetical protein